MSRFLIYAIVFIEGFCSLGAEVIALRRLVPHIGSSIVVTAPTIGFFLLALALGYASGAKVSGNYLTIVARNFLIAADDAFLRPVPPPEPTDSRNLSYAGQWLLFAGVAIAGWFFFLRREALDDDAREAAAVGTSVPAEPTARGS